MTDFCPLVAGHLHRQTEAGFWSWNRLVVLLQQWQSSLVFQYARYK